MPAPNTRVCLLYGNSGTFKTTQMGFAAKWIYEKYGKITRMITAETFEAVMPYRDAGIIDLISLRSSKTVLSDLRKFRRGDWPKIDPKTGNLGWAPWTAKDTESIGAYIIEGTTSISDALMAELRARQQKIGQDAVTPFEMEGEKFSNNSMGHYGFVQSEVHDFIVHIGGIPVERVFITGHEAKAEDEDTKSPIRGPALAGKAKTDKVPSWVGECLHAESYNDEKTEKGFKRLETKVRVFFIKHPDQLFPNITYPAKPRVPANKIPDLMKHWPGGYFEPTVTDGLDRYLEKDLELSRGQADDLRAWKEKIDAERAIVAAPVTVVPVAVVPMAGKVA